MCDLICTLSRASESIYNGGIIFKGDYKICGLEEYVHKIFSQNNVITVLNALGISDDGNTQKSLVHVCKYLFHH